MSRLATATGIVLALALAACASTGGTETAAPPAPPVAPPVAQPAAPPAAPAAAPPAGQAAAPAGVEAAPATSLEDTNAFSACQQRVRRGEILLDTANRRLYQTVCGASLWFDGLFGERDLDAALKSSGRLEVATEYTEFTGVHARVRFHLQVKLPALEDRLSAFVGRDDQSDFARDRTEGQALRSRRRPTDRDDFLVGLGFAGVTTDQFQSDFKVGVGGLRLPKVFVQNRFSYIPYSQEDNRVMLRVTPFWNNRDGFGVTSSTSFDHTIAETFLLRWGTVATYSEASAGLDWRTAAILYQNLLGSRALAYEAFIRGATGAPEPLGEYGVRTVWREPFFRERVFGEFVLGYSWPRDDPALDRQGSVDVGVGIELPFGARAS